MPRYALCQTKSLMSFPAALPLGTILIADDDETHRLLTQRLLEAQGYVCDCVSSSTEVESRLQAREYDLLISDIDMPGNEQLQLITRLPQIHQGLPVILITGVPDMQTAMQSIRLSVVAYLTKPFDSGELIAHVRQNVARYRCYKAVAGSRQRMQETYAALEQMELLLQNPGTPESAATLPQAFLDVILGNAVQSLMDFRVLAETYFSNKADTMAALEKSRPAVLMQAIWETIGVLEKTKHSFKSKELAELRVKLEALVGKSHKPTLK